jgi:hypothetical protein
MIFVRPTLAIPVLVCSLMMAGFCTAQEYSPSRVMLSTLPGPEGTGRAFYVTLGLRKYINSFTSYQFPNYPPSNGPQNPLSRLEHPWEQVYGLVRLGTDLGTIAFNLDFAGTLFKFSSLKGQDSDWSNRDDPGQKTTFSQYEARPGGWTLDLSAVVPVPDAPILAGVLGFRAQHFDFDGYNSVQGGIWDSNTKSYRNQTNWEVTNGPVGEFSQDYKHWYAGGVSQRSVSLGALFDSLASVSLLIKLQADCALVNGNNADFHFLRADKGTFDETKGWSWHVNLTTGVYVGDRLRVDAEGDFMRIRTTGTHQENKSVWEGAKVWSDQQFVTITGRYAF